MEDLKYALLSLPTYTKQLENYCTDLEKILLLLFHIDIGCFMKVRYPYFQISNEMIILIFS